MPMGMFKQNPRYNVVSLRVSDEDMKILKRLVTREQMTISDLLRDALEVLRQRLEESQPLPPLPQSAHNGRHSMRGSTRH